MKNHLLRPGAALFPLAGLAAGAIAMESDQTINPGMSAQALKDRMSKN